MPEHRDFDDDEVNAVADTIIKLGTLEDIGIVDEHEV